jgi:hypothetical protein
LSSQNIIQAHKTVFRFPTKEASIMNNNNNNNNGRRRQIIFALLDPFVFQPVSNGGGVFLDYPDDVCAHRFYFVTVEEGQAWKTALTALQQGTYDAEAARPNLRPWCRWMVDARKFRADWGEQRVPGDLRQCWVDLEAGLNLRRDPFEPLAAGPRPPPGPQPPSV